jgi:AcrR family transcriptional regulator
MLTERKRTKAGGVKAAACKAPGECIDRRASLVEAAYHAIAENGIEGLRTRDIAVRAGIHHATFHYYFATKTDLIIAIVDRLREQFMASFALLPAQYPVADHLRAYLQESCFQMTKDPKRYMVIIQIFQLAGREPAINDVLRARPCNNDWELSLCEVMQAGIDNGEFRSDIAYSEVAHTIMTFCLGLPTFATKHPDKVQESSDQFSNMLLAYICRPR